MNNMTEENVIFLKDLIFTALRRWKAMLLVGAVLAGLLGGYKALSGWNSISTQPDPEVYARQLKNYESNRQILQETAAKQQKSIERQQEYMTNSILMELDPFDHYRVKFTVYADTEYPVAAGSTMKIANKTTHILSAYQAKFASAQTAQILAEAVGIEAMYFSELCTVTLSETSASITVIILYPTEEGAQLLLEQLNTQFELFRKEFNSTICTHNAQILEGSVSRTADHSLMEKQSVAGTHLQELVDALTQTNANIDALVPPTTASGSRSPFIKKVLIFAILGAIAGAGLVAICTWVAMVASQKVYSSRALRGRVGIKVIGCLCPGIPKNVIDRWLWKLEGRDLTEPEARAAVLARDVHNRCDGVSKLLVTGDMDEAQRAFFVAALTQAMPDVKVIDHGSILRCAEAVNALAECDKVLLVEECGSSRYNNIASQCQKAADYGKDLLGCILLGG